MRLRGSGDRQSDGWKQADFDAACPRPSHPPTGLPRAETRPMVSTSFVSAQNVEFDAPLDIFLPWAVAENRAWYKAREVQGGEWADNIFHFIRLCRYHVELFALDAETAADRVEDVLAQRFRHKIGDRDVWEAVFEDVADGYSADPSWESFVEQWGKIRSSVTDDPLKLAGVLANEQPISLASAGARRRPAVDAFLSIAGHLQGILGPGKPIALPVERIGEMIGVTRQRAGFIRNRLVRAEILKPVEGPRKPKGAQPGRAATFLFAMDKWPLLKRLYHSGEDD